MAKKGKVGLYWGMNSVAASLVKSKKVTATSYADISAEQDSVESLQENVKIQASLNKILREAQIESKDINLSVADRNFIFRYLEMPYMSKKDIESSLIFEIEKYIPFKTEELFWDYDYIQSRKEKKTKVSFLGMRESNYNQIGEVLSQLELSLKSLEPASISLVRLIKSKKRFSKDNHFAILDASNYEGYLTFFQDELPVFNRHFDISQTEGEFDKDKFIEAVSYSFQYFRREYKKANIEKIILVGDFINEKTAVSLGKTLGLNVEKIPTSELISFKKQLTIEEVKASGVAQRESLNYRFTPVLEKKEKVAETESTKLPDIAVGWRLGPLAALVAVGILACSFLWFGSNHKEWSKKSELAKEEKNIKLPDEVKDFTWKAIEKKVEEKESQVSYIERRESFYPEIWPFFVHLEQKDNIPEHLWIEDLEVSLEKEGYRGGVSGYVYFQDSIKESIAVDNFVNNLKNNEDINAIFTEIQLKSVNKRQLKDYPVTRFDIDFKK